MIVRKESVIVATASDGKTFYGPNAKEECQVYEQSLISTMCAEIYDNALIVKDVMDYDIRIEYYYIKLKNLEALEQCKTWFKMHGLVLTNCECIDESWVGEWFIVTDPECTNHHYIPYQMTLNTQIKMLTELNHSLTQLDDEVKDKHPADIQSILDNFCNRKK